MFKNIKIKNFKAIKELEIAKFNKINIFAGGNASGKTTILEAIFLLSAFCNTEKAIVHFPISRNMFLSHKEDLELLFHKLIYENAITISGKYNANEIFTSYSSLYNGEGAITGLTNNYKFNKTKGTEEVNYSAKIAENNSFHITKSGNIDDKKHLIKSQFCSITTNNAYSVKHITELTSLGMREQFINSLNTIFNINITETYVDQGMIKVRIPNEFRKGVDIPILGDGLNQAIKLLANLYSEQKILLIDEIENGLHHSIAKELLNAVFKISIKNNCQLFITTHNEETLQIIADLMQTDEELFKNITHHRVKKKDDDVKVFSYSENMLFNALDLGSNVR